MERTKFTIEVGDHALWPIQFAREVGVAAKESGDSQFLFDVPDIHDVPTSDIVKMARAIVLGSKAIRHVMLKRGFGEEPIIIILQPITRARPVPGHDREQEARDHNQHRFLLLDLVTGRANEERLDEISQNEYQWFLDNGQNITLGVKQPTIHRFGSDISIVEASDPIADFTERYNLPFIDI